MDLAQAMSRFGFTKYESLAYDALLRLGPLTGYELGKQSGVPLSKSYVTLQRLVDKGAALVEQTEPPRYAPVAPETLAASCRAGFMADITALLEAAAMRSAGREESHIWCATGRANVLNLAGELVRESIYGVRIEADPVDLQTLRPVLDEARGKVRVSLFRKDPEEEEPARTGSIILLSDDRRILAGTTAPDDACRAVCTENAGIVGLGLARFRIVESRAAPAEEATTPRSVHENWLAWEDRKHRDLVGRRN